MNDQDQVRFNNVYERHINELTLQGKSNKTIEMYSRSLRRLSNYFNTCPDVITTEQLKQYFLALAESHSWSSVKIDRNGQQVTFRFKDSQTKQWQTITESAVQFLWRVLQPVLPKGFRRARDYRILHCLAKATLKRVQLMLNVSIPLANTIIKKVHCCPCCGNPMHVTVFSRLPSRSPWRTS